LTRRASARDVVRALLIAACFALPAPASAQVPAPQNSSQRKWEINDNSFLVEEAFNQEAGVVQNILTWTRSRGGAWNASFTQEWPVPGITHQLSYTLVYANNGDARGIGDALLNYRYQLREETARGPAVAPRLRHELIGQRIEQASERLASLWRLAGLAHPERPLQRGFVRVTDREGQTLVHAAAARSAGLLSLRFADGTVEAIVEGSVARLERAAPRSYRPRRPGPTGQPGLFDED